MSELDANAWAALIAPAILLAILWVIWRVLSWYLHHLFWAVDRFYFQPPESNIHRVLRILCAPTLGLFWILGAIVVCLFPAAGVVWGLTQARNWWHRH